MLAPFQTLASCPSLALFAPADWAATVAFSSSLTPYSDPPDLWSGTHSPQPFIPYGDSLSSFKLQPSAIAQLNSHPPLTSHRALNSWWSFIHWHISVSLEVKFLKDRPEPGWLTYNHIKSHQHLLNKWEKHNKNKLPLQWGHRETHPVFYRKGKTVWSLQEPWFIYSHLPNEQWTCCRA